MDVKVARQTKEYKDGRMQAKAEQVAQAKEAHSTGAPLRVQQLMQEGRRYCYYVPAGQYDDDGYIPSLVFENEAGHYPMSGSGKGAAPWHWGKTLEQAQAVAQEQNARLGITPENADTIVASSFRASNRMQRRTRG